LIELQQGSDPRDSDDVWPSSEGKGFADLAFPKVNLLFGDESGSESEVWRVTLNQLVNGVNQSLDSYVSTRGTLTTRQMDLERGETYSLQLSHVSSNLPNGPDLDYTFDIEAGDPVINFITAGASQILGTFEDVAFSSFSNTNVLLAIPFAEFKGPVAIGGNGEPDTFFLQGAGNRTALFFKAGPTNFSSGEIILRQSNDLINIYDAPQNGTLLTGGTVLEKTWGLPSTDLASIVAGKHLYLEPKAGADLDDHADLEVVYRKDGFELLLARLRVRPLEIKVEPITGEGGVPPFNPASIVVGDALRFHVDIGGGTYPADQIQWSITNGIAEFVGDASGETVIVKGLSAGQISVNVRLGQSVEPLGGFDVEIRQLVELPAVFYIVTSTDGTTKAISISYAINHFKEANAIWKQAGIRFRPQYGGEIRNSSYFAIQDVATLDALTSENFNTGKLEVYFVNSLPGLILGTDRSSTEDAREGITTTGSLSAQILAHELGHAVGLDDFYTSQSISGQTVTTGTELIREAWLPEDWSDFYEVDLTQTDLLERLLMFGIFTTNGNDIPAGRIYGVHRFNGLSMGAVGMSDILFNEMPVSHW